MKRVCYVFALAIVLSPFVFGMEIQDAENSKDLDEIGQPRIKLSVYQTNEFLDSQLSISVQIDNLTNSNIAIMEIQAHLPEMTCGRREESPLIKDLSMKGDLEPGNSIIETVTFRKGTKYIFPPFMRGDVLLFTPGEYKARVVVKYLLFGKNEMMIEEQIGVKLVPPVASILWGSVLGAFLLALFVVLYEQKQLSPSRGFREAGIKVVYMTMLGALCGVIIIFLLLRLKGIMLPITITINDFYGGVVIGLFAYSLGNWLFSKLMSLKSKTDKLGDKEIL